MADDQGLAPPPAMPVAPPAEEIVVNVRDPDTREIGSIPQSQFNQAISQGFTVAPDDEVKQYVKEQKFGTGTEAVKGALEGAAKTITYGASSGIERALGVDPEDIRAREEVNPWAHAVGQVAPFLIPGSAIVRGIGALGKGAGMLAGEVLGSNLAARLGAKAVAAGVENAIFQGGNEVSKMLLSDPDQTVGTAAANIGLSGLIGGGIGGATGGVGELWNATIGKRVAKALGSATDEIAAGAASPIDDQYFQRNLISGAEESKGNIGAIQEAASRLGVTPTEGMISAEPVVQKLENTLANRGTIFGQKAAKETDAVFEGLNDAAKETLRDATVKTEAQVGREIKEGLQKGLEAELKPIEARYEGLKPHFKNMQLSDELKSAASQSILDNELVKIAPNSKAAGMANSLSEEIAGLKTVEDVKTYRTLINKRLDAAYRAGGEELPVLQTAKQALNDLREAGISNAVKETGIGRGAKQITEDTINEIREADKLYGAYKNKLKDVGVEAGLGKINNARALLDRFSKLSDESFASKVFDTNDINQLNYFKQNFPKEFDLARRFKLQDIYQNSINEAQGKNGAFEVGKFLRQISDTKMSPEARSVLFDGKNLEKINDIQTLFRTIPSKVGPSGTAEALSFGHMFSMQGVLENASDAVKYAMLKSLPYLREAASAAGVKGEAAELAALKFAASPGKAIEPTAFKSMVRFIADTVRGENLLGKSVRGVFHGTQNVLPSVILPDEKKLEKLDKKLKGLQTNVEPLFDVGTKTAHYMPEAGQKMAEVSASAVNYLNGLRPVPGKKNPLDADIEPSPMQKAAFTNALQIAEQPLVVLDRVKAGTLTSTDLVHLKSLYPGLYNRLSQKVTSEMIETVNAGETIPYKTRLGLSLFLGQPLDSTMTPQSIMAAQPQAQQPPQMPQGESQPRAKHSMTALNKLPSSYQTPQQARQASKLQS